MNWCRQQWNQLYDELSVSPFSDDGGNGDFVSTTVKLDLYTASLRFTTTVCEGFTNITLRLHEYEYESVTIAI